MTTRHPLLIKKSQQCDAFVCLDFAWGKIPLKSISFMKDQCLLFTFFYQISTCPRGKITQLLQANIHDRIKEFSSGGGGGGLGQSDKIKL